MRPHLSLAVLVAACCAGAPAFAAVTHDFGSVSGTESATLSDTFAGAQTFDYTFTVDAVAEVFGSWSSTPLAYNLNPVQYATAYNGAAGGFNFGGGSYFDLQYYPSSFSFKVDPGTYTLSFVAFTVPYDQQALFTTHAAVTALSALPEPQTYAFLLAGLVATGFLARRRSAPETGV